MVVAIGEADGLRKKPRGYVPRLEINHNVDGCTTQVDGDNGDLMILHEYMRVGCQF